MANRSLDGTVLDYAVPIDSVEARTGIDFFANLEDGLENQLEARVDKILWQ
jgi:endonuclease G